MSHARRYPNDKISSYKHKTQGLHAFQISPVSKDTQALSPLLFGARGLSGDGVSAARMAGHEGRIRRHVTSQLHTKQASGSVSLGAPAALPFPESESPGFVHCAAGHCEPLEKEGVNVDGWGMSRDTMRRVLPLPPLDHANNVTIRRLQNQRQGRFAREDVAARPGVRTPAVQWGAASGVRFFETDTSPGARTLELKGVRVSGLDLYDGRALAQIPSMFPTQTESASNVKLESKGVKVTGTGGGLVPGKTCGKAGLPDCFTAIDGAADRIVTVQHVPRHRKEGVAAQERPAERLLDPDTDWAQPEKPVGAGGMQWD